MIVIIIMILTIIIIIIILSLWGGDPKLGQQAISIGRQGYVNIFSPNIPNQNVIKVLILFMEYFSHQHLKPSKS